MYYFLILFNIYHLYRLRMLNILLLFVTYIVLYLFLGRLVSGA